MICRPHIHGDILPDVLIVGLDLVFCGTAPSKTSAEAGAYYANSRNSFWKILHECEFTDSELKPENFEKLTTKNIGLTDLCKFACGSDDQLPPNAFDPERLRKAIQKYRPRFLAFASGHAGQKFFGRNVKYGRHAPVGETNVFVLPTTSPRRGDGWWREKKVHWHNFAEEFRRSCSSEERVI